MGNASSKDVGNASSKDVGNAPSKDVGNTLVAYCVKSPEKLGTSQFHRMQSPHIRNYYY